MRIEGLYLLFLFEKRSERIRNIYHTKNGNSLTIIVFGGSFELKLV